MQISDLNSNLIHALGGKSVSQSNQEGKSSEFADVLRVSAEELGGFDDTDKHFEVNFADCRGKTTDVDVKKNESSDNQASEQKKHQDNDVVTENDNDSVEKSEAGKNKSSSEVRNNAATEPTQNPIVEVEAPENTAVTEGVVLSINPEIFAVSQNDVPEMKGVEFNDVVVSEVTSDQEVVVEVDDGVIPVAMNINPQTEGELFQDPLSDKAVVDDIAAIPLDVVADEVKDIDISNNIVAIDKNTDASLTSEIFIPAEQIVIDNELIQQKAKIAELLPEDTDVKMEVVVKNDNITSFNEQMPLVDVVENAEFEQLDVFDMSSSTSVEDMQVSEVQTIEPEFAVANVVEEIKVVDFVTEKNRSVTDVVNSAVSSFPVNETINQASGAKITNSVNDNFKDIYNKGLTKDIAEQIKVNITQSAIKGVDKVEIKLNPADLGQLEIKMQIGKDGRLHTQIIASNAETLDLLQKDLSSLKDAFNNAGYQTDDGSFSFSYRGEEQNDNEREQLRNFIGEVIAQDVAEELAANNDYVGIDGVNIRV